MKQKKNLTDAERLRIRVNTWQLDPLKYCKEVLGVEQTWRLQDQLLAACPRAIAEKKQIYVASGHSLGKDYICGAIGPWFLQTYRPSVVILTAPTDRQVHDVMWKETKAHWNHRVIDLGGRAFIEPRIEIAKDWFLTGFTTKETGATKEGGGGKFQGFHSKNICIIVTEAQAVEDPIYDQIDAIATAENCLIIFIGNPTRAKGRFAAGLKDRAKNIVFNFSCLENPNYLERRIVIPGLATYEWVEDKRTKWGETDPRWIGRVLGQVPEGGVNFVFPDSLREKMRGRHGMLNIHDLNCGVAWDPSGEGVDDEVWMVGNNGEVLEVVTETRCAPSVGAIRAVELCKKHNGYFIIVDCDGVGIKGWQELDRMSKDYLSGIQILKFHGSSKSKLEEGEEDHDRKLLYENLRCEAAFVTRDRAERGAAALNSRDTELDADLAEEIWMENKKSGLIQLIPKDEIKEILGRSPGRGDCYKMLQWAFEQLFQDKTYDHSTKLPEYSLHDRDIDIRSLPRYST